VINITARSEQDRVNNQSLKRMPISLKFITVYLMFKKIYIKLVNSYLYAGGLHHRTVLNLKWTPQLRYGSIRVVFFYSNPRFMGGFGQLSKYCIDRNC
jgi:hypothetical protein